MKVQLELVEEIIEPKFIDLDHCKNAFAGLKIANERLLADKMMTKKLFDDFSKEFQTRGATSESIKAFMNLSAFLKSIFPR